MPRKLDPETIQKVKNAMFRADFDTLNELAPCYCCCDEHFAPDCPAHLWMGCRGSYAVDRLERLGQGYAEVLESKANEAWAKEQAQEEVGYGDAEAVRQD